MLGWQLTVLWRKTKYWLASILLTLTGKRREWQESLATIKQEAAQMARDKTRPPRPTQKVIVVSSQAIGGIRVELSFVETLRLAGYEPVVMAEPFHPVCDYFRAWGVTQFISWLDYLPAPGSVPMPTIPATFQDVLTFAADGCNVGKYVASHMMRIRRKGSFDPQDAALQDVLREQLEQGVIYARAAQNLLDQVKPDGIIFNERGYSPWGQLFEASIHRGVNVMQWVGSHKDDALVLKRYGESNLSEHPIAVSQEAWATIKQMVWSEDHWQRLHDELYRNYASGQWGSKIGVQFDKQLFDKAELQAQLGLDLNKKTAVIFPHLFWDATFFYGRDVFRDYEDWFIQTVQAAVKNPNLNWVIKVHPANMVKAARDGYSGEHSEVAAIRKHIGQLPDHIKLVSPETKINTFSFYAIMDYCVTVRGTVGIEAAIFGIPVLTAGSGRYDGRGFTVDSQTPPEYLDRLAHLHELPPLTAQQTELARRFAYGTFIMRPWALQAITFAFKRDKTASAYDGFKVGTLRELVESPEMVSFREWFAHSRAEDYLADG